MGVKSLSIAVRALGYIYFNAGLKDDIINNVIYQINNAYRSDVEVEREAHHTNIVKVDIFGNNMIDYELLLNILKDNKKYLSDEVSIGEWVESDGGLYFNPEEDEE